MLLQDETIFAAASPELNSLPMLKKAVAKDNVVKCNLREIAPRYQKA
jgi:hypothetical protein